MTDLAATRYLLRSNVRACANGKEDEEEGTVTFRMICPTLTFPFFQLYTRTVFTVQTVSLVHSLHETLFQ